MLVKEIVINAFPLIVLFKSNQADLLPELFERIFIPQAVFDEVSDGNDLASQQVSTVSWLTTVAIETMSPEVASWDLGKGESAVLTLSSQMPDTIAVVDDRAARRCAKTLGVATLGTGGVLVLAKRRGLISAVAPRLQALRDAGLWLSDPIFDLLKQQAGEH